MCLACASTADVLVTPQEMAIRDTWVNSNLEHQMPFSFSYGNRESAKILSAWDRKEDTEKLDAVRTRRTIMWTDSKTGLVLRFIAISYADFPMVEWTLYFKNSGGQETPILSDILPLELKLMRGQKSEFVLHHHAGSNATMDDYRTYEKLLKPKTVVRMATSGGRGSDACWPYFNVDWGSEGTIVVV